MNAITQAQENLIIYYKRTEKRGKWYEQDLQDYIRHVTSIKDVARLETMLNNMRNLREDNSPLDKFCKREEDKMLRHGLYDLNKMKPINQLD